MKGAETMLRTLVNGGVDVCFTNPGTSEMQFVSAIDRVEGMRCVLALFEGVASGAADAYARMTDKPAATLFHLGPGLANAMANFHNAMRAGAPIVNIVGEHATYHRQYDSLLGSDIEAYAKPTRGWMRTTETAEAVPADTQAAIVAAHQPPGQIATLIVPADCTWNDAGDAAPAPDQLPTPAAVAADAVEAVAKILASGEPAVLLLAGRALRTAALETASRIANKTGARMMCETLVARMERGAGRTELERLPYFPEQAVEALTGTRHLILVGARPPVGAFAYPDKPSWLSPEDCTIHTLATIDQDLPAALLQLADAVDAAATAPTLLDLTKPELPTGDFTPETVGLTLAASLPEDAIVVDEAATSGAPLFFSTAAAEPHDWLMLTGGAIGNGLPLTVGAAVACPDRKVVGLQADGSGMYTVQSLWTQAREQLNVTNVVFANRLYRILGVEFQRVGAGEPGPKARELLEIGRPDLDWVKMAEGMGVTAARATSLEEFNRLLPAFIAEQGPNLIEAVV